jgi:hypothetical protein
MSIREGTRFMIYTAATEVERPAFCHFGKFVFEMNVRSALFAKSEVA